MTTAASVGDQLMRDNRSIKSMLHLSEHSTVVLSPHLGRTDRRSGNIWDLGRSGQPREFARTQMATPKFSYSCCTCSNICHHPHRSTAWVTAHEAPVQGYAQIEYKNHWNVSGVANLLNPHPFYPSNDFPTVPTLVVQGLKKKPDPLKRVK